MADGEGDGPALGTMASETLTSPRGTAISCAGADDGPIETGSGAVNTPLAATAMPAPRARARPVPASALSARFLMSTTRVPRNQLLHILPDPG